MEIEWSNWKSLGKPQETEIGRPFAQGNQDGRARYSTISQEFPNAGWRDIWLSKAGKHAETSSRRPPAYVDPDRVTFETIMVAVGREFTVRLKSRPTTGHRWQVHTLAEGVQLLGSGCEKPMDGIRRGKKVFQVVRFRAPAVGEYTIRFVLKGRAEGEAIQAHTVTVDS